MKRVEAICDAVAAYYHYHEPWSVSYELRNPIMLPAEYRDPRTDAGMRIFSSHRAGYQAAVDRVEKYCAANREAMLRDLLEWRGVKDRIQQDKACEFLGLCLSSNVPTLDTPLSWFTEE